MDTISNVNLLDHWLQIPIVQDVIAANLEQKLLTREWEGVRKGRQEGIEQGIEKGIEKGIEQGIEKGREEDRRMAIARMKAEGLSDDFIAKIYGITSEKARHYLT